MLFWRHPGIHPLLRIPEITVLITDDRALTHIAEYFRALSEPLRLKIINLLREKSRNVGELTECLGCSQANVSKHLAILARTGLVSRQSQGTSVFYQIADARIYELCDLVCGRLGEHFANQAELQTLFNPIQTESKVQPLEHSPQPEPKKL